MNFHPLLISDLTALEIRWRIYRNFKRSNFYSDSVRLFMRIAKGRGGHHPLKRPIRSISVHEFADRMVWACPLCNPPIYSTVTLSSFSLEANFYSSATLYSTTIACCLYLFAGRSSIINSPLDGTGNSNARHREESSNTSLLEDP